jgi:hypothetical protein
MDSDTDLMVLSFVPSTREGEPLTIEEATATARIVEKLNGTHRLLIHGRVNPNQPGDLESMDELAARYKISAWKTYTQWGPAGTPGFYMDDEPGIAMIEKARKLGVRNIAIHKGLRSGRARTNTRPVSTSAASRSATRTSTFSSITRAMWSTSPKARTIRNASTASTHW